MEASGKCAQDDAYQMIKDEVKEMKKVRRETKKES